MFAFCAMGAIVFIAFTIGCLICDRPEQVPTRADFETDDELPGLIWREPR